ncbi:GMP synthetase [Tieghemostelium lacteum]|uniref:GMP synthase (glutamine-hydrolyzing) n=1 Tax=Tieghemostelium lacteum TaxID=361077 RepID=A0A151Z900_TIELA|nr:GMP synthetase [Tieghemostelium lacteum]|eukprot:KYQ90422.1 GMP synthetase [Tieghemostelium lacteum]
MSKPIISTPPLSKEVRLESNLSNTITDDQVNHSEVVLILDAGSQYSKVIDRRVRELNVASEIHISSVSIEELVKQKSSAGTKIRGIIISGGPESVYSANAPKFDSELLNCYEKHQIPLLGICYGMQYINHFYGGIVEKSGQREDGVHHIHILQGQEENVSPLFNNMDTMEQVLLTHGDSVTTVAPGFHAIAKSEDGIVSAIENSKKKIFGVQFHPEVDLTTNGKKMLKNFLLDICKCKADYTLEDREQLAIEMIRNTVGQKKVLVLVSGGVDSTVCAALIAKAIDPSNVYALHIDNGFMRMEESSKVAKALSVLGLHLIVVDSSEQFYNGTTTIRGHQTLPMNQCTNPEEIRKIIGDTFMRVAEKEVQKLGLKSDDVFLAQGTLRPDLIESSSKTVSGSADVIKTHHNDTELVRVLRDSGRVVEPLKDLHKDEVRQLGISLGLSEELVWRQPFPGPGLAIRILCSQKPYLDVYDLTNQVINYIVTGKQLDNVPSLPQETVQKINQQLQEMKFQPNESHQIRPLLLPVQTVGVQGDGRTYSYLVGLYSSSSQMELSKIPWSYLFTLARLLPKICHNINRLVFIFSNNNSKYPVDLNRIYEIKETTPTLLLPEAIQQLQQADQIVNKSLLNYQLIRSLSQVPVVLLPLGFGHSQKRSIAIRTFITNDFMTGVPAIPGQNIPFECLTEMVTQILNLDGITKVCYDLTSKPPGTTEFQ